MLLCLAKKIRYRRLARNYGFDPWHARSPFECRAYKREVVHLANGLQPRVAVEIGCGLGEILARVEAGRRLGFDIDPNVVAAARHLYGSRCEFAVAGAGDVDTVGRAVGAPGAELLIMVNWAHAVAWPELAAQIRGLARATSLRYLIIDTIAAGIPGYAHHHSPAELATLGPVRADLASADGVRRLAMSAPGRSQALIPERPARQVAR
jgi:SAM-dependent methyltransferase